ncbi:unnamed protein product [Paramecium primaurelia]|uniref:Uncharacterized protein n=1 Tax=Paramecium primaurelia TaxID=5886 RepID=A0A8S1Q478_PARPR|nr:unnamed protein product [Paramecium primaurelia]
MKNDFRKLKILSFSITRQFLIFNKQEFVISVDFLIYIFNWMSRDLIINTLFNLFVGFLNCEWQNNWQYIKFQVCSNFRQSQINQMFDSWQFNKIHSLVCSISPQLTHMIFHSFFCSRT